MSRIQIYARIRPGPQRCEGFQASANSISLRTGYERDALFSKSPAAKHEFTFDQVFEEGSSQEDVFQKVALPVVDQFLLGYNGTVFAYGQTSSGKTYTMEGSARKYAERGIIPRVLSYMFEELEKRTGEEWSVHVSYMEIYQDIGFDLLNPGSRPGSLMVTLPKVSVGEGPGGEVMVRNLSTHLAANEEVALSLLFQGSTCRKVAETSMNQCSSRSHSIFSITLTTRGLGSEVVTRSKMNLVDLAGSERVAKTGADGRVLQEAKHINLSLHHLEHVIVSLQHLARRGTPHSRLSSTPSCNKRRSPSYGHRPPTTTPPSSTTSRRGESRSSSSPNTDTKANHIPYRNCLLTLVLKDSLGGNCLTAMIATVSPEAPNVWETVSTCRFSQRVAAISNKARRNEELDDKALIKKLKQRVSQLEEELLALKQAGPGSILPSDPLDEAGRVSCHQLLHSYLHGQTKDLVEEGINTLPWVQECFKVFRDIIIQSLGIGDETHTGKGGASGRGLAPDKKQRKSVKDKSPPHSGMVAMGTVAMGKTPSPNSRQSSGFGSLQDEDGGLCESFSKELTNPVQTEVYYTPATMYAAPSAPVNTHSWAKQASSRERPVVRATPHQHHTNASTPTGVMSSDVMSSATKVQSLNSQELQMSIYSQQPHPPSIYGQQLHPQWADALGSEVQGMNETLVPRPSFFDVEAEGPQSFSKGKSRPGVKQHPREHQVFREHQELVGEVQMLALRVEEEKLQGQLAQVAEHLARQHAQVLQLESSDAATPEELCSERTPEELCSERTAEQQLKIRHAKLHQKLLDVQHQMKMLEIVRSDGREGGKMGGATTEDGGGVKHSSPPPRVGHKVISEQSRHDTQQSKVQDQMDKLRVLQMEKQLELKEAATRRRLLAMKQQLSRATPPTQGNSPLSPSASSDTRSHQVILSPPGVHVSSNVIVTPGARIASNALSPPGVHIPSHTTNVPVTLGPSPLHSHRTSLDPSPSVSLDQARPLPTSPAKSWSDDVPIRTATMDTMSRKTKMSITGEQRTNATPPGEHRTKATLPGEQSKATLPGEQRTKATPPGEQSKVTLPEEPRTKATPLGEQRTKVSLTEECKETAYMSGVDRQKARVARVRRCIAAATIIQRWWRRRRARCRVARR